MDEILTNGINNNKHTELFTNNVNTEFTYIINVARLLIIDTPLLILKICWQVSWFVLFATYFILRTIFFILPKGIFTFTKNYIRDLCFVIIDSFTWPINKILGIKPIYQKDSWVNSLLSGNALLPYSFYIQVIFSDVMYPITMNFLLVMSIGFMIGLIQYALDRVLRMFHSKKLVIHINPFETTKTLFDNAYNDVRWVVELANSTLQTFSEMVKPLNSLRNIDEKVITTELKKVHQEYNPMTIRGAMNIIWVVKDKVFSKGDKNTDIKKSGKETISSRPSTQGTDISFDSLDGELTRRNIIIKTDSIDKHNDKTTMQRISSIDLAENLPKDFFQEKNSTKIEDSTVLNGNSTKKIESTDT